MTKDELVQEIVKKTGIEKVAVEATVEAIMETIKSSMENGENIYLRGFGTFLLKSRKQKIGRNITKNTSVTIPAHVVPVFKPAKEFVTEIKTKVKVK
jgi:DNA-binding protein HU-beta